MTFTEYLKKRGWTTLAANLLLVSSLLLISCGGGGGGRSSGDEYSETYDNYISIAHPTLLGPNLGYSTRKAWIMPSGGARAPSSADCSSEEVFFPPPSEYQITITNSANNYSIRANALISCARYFPTVIWSTYNTIPLELGENKLIVNLSYPTESISGQAIQIVTREPTTGPIIERTYPEDENASPGTQFFYTNIAIYAVFDSEIDPDSVGADTFIVRDQNSVPITGSFEVEDFEVGFPFLNPDWTYSRVTFIPDFPLPPMARATVTISETIRDIAGREMGFDYNWSFRTGSS